jgi:outer membrane protein assembly factor BamB
MLFMVALLLSAAPAGAAVPVWSTYNHDGARTAADPDSGSPVSPTVAWSAQAQLDGSVWAQPLVVGSRVYVATENDTIYALDAATGHVVWQQHVGSPVPSGNLGCGNISPTVGITSTPVIDVAAGHIYAVADTINGAVIQHRLVALSLSDGSPVAGFPVPVDPPGADPGALLNRASLALDAGRVIIPYGGNDGDCNTYHGWLVSAAASNPASQSYFEVASGANQHGGAIWGGGGAPAIDSGGHLFVSTGNGFSAPSNTVPDFQESVVELDPSLTVIAHWTASNWKALDNSDTDLGSSEPLPLPGGLLFQAGKDGVGRLLSATALGTTGQVFSAAACGSGVYGAALYRAGVIYAPCPGGLAALRLSASPTPNFTAVSGWSPPAGAASPPIFAGGLVWSTGRDGNHTLYGLDPATGAIRFQSTVGAFNHFSTPSAGGGRLFVAAGSKLAAFQIASFPPGTSTALTASSNPARSDRGLTLTATVNPAPDGGTVSFTDGARAVSGCASVALTPGSGQASCGAHLAVGSHVLAATYSGDPYFGSSSSAALHEVVLAPGPIVPPKLSAVSLSAHRVTARRGITLRLRLSATAQVRVTIVRARSGRKVRGRCRLGAKRGRRCTVLGKPRLETFNGKRGANRLRLNLRRLTPGNYLAKVLARSPAGLSSKTVTLRFVIVR